MSETPDMKSPTVAAGFVWLGLRNVKFDPARDDPADCWLHERLLAACRENWPWLDDKADALAVAVHRENP